MTQYRCVEACVQWGPYLQPEFTGVLEPAGVVAPVNLAHQARVRCGTCGFEWATPVRGLPTVPQGEEPAPPRRGYAIAFSTPPYSDEDAVTIVLQEGTTPWDAVVWAWAKLQGTTRPMAVHQLSGAPPHIAMVDLETKADLSWAEIQPPWVMIENANIMAQTLDTLLDTIRPLCHVAPMLNRPIIDMAAVEELRAQRAQIRHTIQEIKDRWEDEQREVDESGRSRKIEL